MMKFNEVYENFNHYFSQMIMTFSEIQNDGKLLEEPLDERPTTIGIFRDDCISVSIFDYLSKQDLHQLTLVSKRLNALNDRAFYLRFAKKRSGNENNIFCKKNLSNLKELRYLTIWAKYNHISIL